MRLTTTLVIDVLEGNEGFVLYTDGSKLRLECVLMQNRRVFAYTSLQLKPHKLNNPIDDLELAAVIHALKNLEALLVLY